MAFDNGSEFKRYFTTLLKYFDIKPILKTVKNPQSNALMEWVNQLILNILFTKYLDNKVSDHIDPCGETLSSISWAIRDYYHRTIMATPGQAVFGRDVLFNLTSEVY